MSDPNTPQQPADPNQPPVSPPPPPYGQQPTQQQPQQPVPPQYGQQPQQPQPGQQPPSYGQQAPQQPPQYGQQPPQYGQQPPQYAQQQPPQYAQQPPQYGQPQYPQPQYAAAAPQPLSPEADKSAAMWANIGGIIGFLPSLIIWLVLKDRGPRTNVEAKEALNWQITFTILYVALWIVVGILNGIFFAAGIFFLPGILALLPWVLWILNVVFSIIAGVRINDGGSYRYPWNFRFIK